MTATRTAEGRNRLRPYAALLLLCGTAIATTVVLERFGAAPFQLFLGSADPILTVAFVSGAGDLVLTWLRRQRGFAI